jgi:ribosomal-protein-alanine N-acetyltransferase
MPDVMTAAKGTNLRTTPATIADLDDLLQIEQESFTAPWTRRMFETELCGNQFGHVWTAQVEEGTGEDGDGRLIGYICFWLVFEEFRLMNLAVRPSARRRGVGRELMRRALSWGQQKGARRAILEVRGSNAVAIQLYEQLGFRTIGRRTHYYTQPDEDAVIMELEPIALAHD